jgi:Inner membrane protein YgaP-like, transmembrane domain
MNKNVGVVDKTIRIILAILIAILYFTDQISGTVAIVLGIIAIMLLLTSLVSFCPFYAVVKLSTIKNKN